MTYVTRVTESGLVLQELAADEAQLGRALKQIDHRLVLQKHASNVEGGWVYKVICVVSDHYAPIIYTHADKFGNPLPLSSSLIDDFRKSQLRDVRERHGILDADQRNERHVEAIQKTGRANDAEIIAEHRARLERSQTMVSFSDVGKPGIGKGRVRPKSGVQR